MWSTFLNIWIIVIFLTFSKKWWIPDFWMWVLRVIFAPFSKKVPCNCFNYLSKSISVTMSNNAIARDILDVSLLWGDYSNFNFISSRLFKDFKTVVRRFWIQHIIVQLLTVKKLTLILSYCPLENIWPRKWLNSKTFQFLPALTQKVYGFLKFFSYMSSFK